MKRSSTFLKLKEEERAYRKEIILESAMKLFSEHSFYEIGMRDIAEEAGISAASIYRYFSSRDDVIAEILEHEVEQGKKMQLERIKSGSPNLADVARGIVDFFITRKSTLQMLGHFLVNDEVEEEAREKFVRIIDQYQTEFEEMLLALGCTKENVSLYAKSFFASILGIIVSYKGHGDNENQSGNDKIYKLAEMAAKIFMGGMPKN